MAAGAIGAIKAVAAANPGRCGVCRRRLGKRNKGYVCGRARCRRARWAAYQADHRGGYTSVAVVRIEQIPDRRGLRRLVLSCSHSVDVTARNALRNGGQVRVFRCPTCSPPVLIDSAARAV